jgi:predicted membrane protein
VGGRVAGALLAIFAGLVLLFLVRFHYVVFLWPLALLAAALVLFGVWMAHAALAFARGNFAPDHLARRSAWAQEVVFWSSVAGGLFVVYLILTEL